ncbi:hypothetical protein K7X08_004579 [Anisodus acutangulus]|uniref:Uncharacterized protein n=1 Tax=Anisodus acutangulus TaxID=402998 RepID=A0A9Q1ME22_9SOLA|nr:hypothetical protein K7X08_004579 [Anisodus acutangulus]
MFNQLLDSNDMVFQTINFLQEFDDWMEIMDKYGPLEMKQCLYYNSGASGYLTLLYKYSFGIIRFIRNYKGHHNEKYNIRDPRHYSVDRALQEVLEFFPGLLGCTYSQLFSILKNEKLSKQKGPVEYRGMLYGKYFCKPPSIFELDKP